MSNLKSTRTEKDRLLKQLITGAFYLVHKSKASQLSFTNDGNLGQVCIGPDEMSSDTFIFGSLLQSMRYHYRQPAWLVMSALKSIKPQGTSLGRNNTQMIYLHLWKRAQRLFRQMALLISVMKPHNSLQIGNSVEPHLHK